MKAQELRIGNYVMTTKYNSCWRIEMFLGTEMVTLDCIGFEYTDDNHDEDTSKLNPIPLTEEWLLKFGFKEKPIIFDEYRAFTYNNEITIIYIRGVFRCTNINMDGRLGFGQYKSLNHVHQLQNLYLALTGEELILNK